MKLAVSNIGWDFTERFEAYALLEEYGISGLEVAPGLLFAGEPDPFRPGNFQLRERMAELTGFGLELVSMQSLLYGVADAQLFGTPEQRGKFEQGITCAINLAQRLGIGNLVLGSPKQRCIPEGMMQDQAYAIARDVFRRLGGTAEEAGCRLALEANAASYGTNYLTDLDQVLETVHAVGHPGIAVNFDVGALHMTGQFGRIAALAKRAMPQISHVHISRPDLEPAPADEVEARIILASLREANYRGAVSIEMRACDDGLKTLRKCIQRLASAASSGLPH